ncbi:MAG: HNH endonuclease signature motif containing protein [Bdellovibrionales bacterium]
MKPEHLKIHEECLKLCQGYLRREAPIVVQLQKVGETKLFKELEMRNLFTYAVKICGLSEGAAYSFIAVGNNAKLYPCLQEAVVSRTLSVSKAIRIVSILDTENAEALVEFAKTHSSKEIEREVRRRNPKVAVRARIKPLTSDTDLLEAPIPRETTEHIFRAQTLLAQKTSKHQGIPETLTHVFKEYVARNDPLKKAERAQTRKATENSAHAEKSQSSTSHGIIPMTAATQHTVDLRDQRRCTHIGKDGKRCNDDRWIHYHHIVHVAMGGSNHPDNITTLCSFHHDLVHQQVFAMEREKSWLRSPHEAYRVLN